MVETCLNLVLKAQSIAVTNIGPFVLLRLFWERSRTEIYFVGDALCYAKFRDAVQISIAVLTHRWKS